MPPREGCLTREQLGELFKIEDTRVARGEPGLHDEVQELIRRVTSGGVAGKFDDLRFVKAKRWFDRGAGRELKIDKFDDYLATIPEAPALPEAWENRFDRLVLVEGRLPLTVLCHLAGLKFSGTDTTFVPYDPAKARSGVRWMWCQNGHKNRNRRPMDCRNSFPQDEVGLDVIEGVSVYVDDPSVINSHFMDLSGSVHADSRDSCACLGRWGDGPKLYWYFVDHAYPGFGSATRGIAA